MATILMPAGLYNREARVVPWCLATIERGGKAILVPHRCLTTVVRGGEARPVPHQCLATVVRARASITSEEQHHKFVYYVKKTKSLSSARMFSVVKRLED